MVCPSVIVIAQWRRRLACHALQVVLRFLGNRRRRKKDARRICWRVRMSSGQPRRGLRTACGCSAALTRERSGVYVSSRGQWPRQSYRYSSTATHKPSINFTLQPKKKKGPYTGAYKYMGGSDAMMARNKFYGLKTKVHTSGKKIATAKPTEKKIALLKSPKSTSISVLKNHASKGAIVKSSSGKVTQNATIGAKRTKPEKTSTTTGKELKVTGKGKAVGSPTTKKEDKVSKSQGMKKTPSVEKKSKPVAALQGVKKVVPVGKTAKSAVPRKAPPREDLTSTRPSVVQSHPAPSQDLQSRVVPTPRVEPPPPTPTTPSPAKIATPIPPHQPTSTTSVSPLASQTTATTTRTTAPWVPVEQRQTTEDLLHELRQRLKERQSIGASTSKVPKAGSPQKPSRPTPPMPSMPPAASPPIAPLNAQPPTDTTHTSNPKKAKKKKKKSKTAVPVRATSSTATSTSVAATTTSDAVVVDKASSSDDALEGLVSYLRLKRPSAAAAPSTFSLVSPSSLRAMDSPYIVPPSKAPPAPPIVLK